MHILRRCKRTEVQDILRENGVNMICFRFILQYLSVGYCFINNGLKLHYPPLERLFSRDCNGIRPIFVGCILAKKIAHQKCKISYATMPLG